MLKKLTLIVAALILVGGAGELMARGHRAKPYQGEGQQQMRKDGQRKRGLHKGRSIDKWLAEMTEAYEQNDGEKMGRLLKGMRQFRKEQQESRGNRATRKQRKAGRHRQDAKSQCWEMDRPQYRSHSRKNFGQGRRRQGGRRSRRGFDHYQRCESDQRSRRDGHRWDEDFRHGKTRKQREFRHYRDSGQRRSDTSEKDFDWDY
ncbi:hypothetical protein ACFL3G_00860 [Planctomycetota bacterium]